MIICGGQRIERDTCRDCWWWNGHHDLGSGECRYYPPTMVAGCIKAIFPVTGYADFCSKLIKVEEVEITGKVES